MSKDDEIKRLTEANSRLESENAAMKLDLYFKDGKLDTLKSYLWDRGNELAESQAQGGVNFHKLFITLVHS